MPALHVFNRRTLFAGDDLQPTVILNIAFRAFQLFLLVIPVFIHLTYETRYFIKYATNANADNEDEETMSPIVSYLFGRSSIYPDECSDGSHYFPLLLYSYLIMTAGHILFSLIVEYIIYKIAGLGSPTQPQMRFSLGKLIEKKWIWSSLVGNFLVLACGIWCFSYKNIYFDCHDIVARHQYYADGDGDADAPDYLTRFLGRRFWWIALISLLLSQCIQAFVALVALGSLLQKEKAIAFKSHNHFSAGASHDDMHGLRYSLHHHELAEEMWSERCHNFCKCAASSTCYLFGGRELVNDIVGDYGQVSRALADYFEDGGVLDLVASDLAAGFIMLQRVQRQRVLEARRGIEEEIQNSRGVNNFLTGSNSSISVDNGHNFSKNKSDRKITSILDENLNSGDLGEGVGLNLPSNTHMMPIFDNMLVSVLEPMPYSRTLLLPDEEKLPSSYDQFNLNANNTSALMLRMIPDGDNRDNRHWYEAQQRKVFNRDDEIDRNLIAEGARFARHSLSIYTWMLYFYMNPVTGIPRLLAGRFAECYHHEKRSENTFSSKCQENNAVGDNWLHVHKNALLAHSGLDDSDLIYANFENKYNQMPYCIVIDHKWQSVVVSIRGTLSLEDCVVDVLVDPEPLDELGREYGFDGEGQYCHSGVLACVRHILGDLRRHNILHTLLSGVGAQYSHYKLRFCGHSLGAGCATLLGYVFRRTFPDLRVIAISPPGGFMTWKLATECNDFVTAFVLDSDLVPRLSVATMEQTRNEILDLVGRIKVPKMQVAKSFLVHGIWKSIKELDDPDVIARENDKILYPTESIPQESDFVKQLEQFQVIQKQRKETRGEYRDIKLFPPGKIVHLVKTGERSSCADSLAKCITCCTSNAGYEYTPVWADNADFNEIVVSPTMAFDHFPNRVCLQLERVADSFGIDTSVGSSEHDREEGERLRSTQQQYF